MTKLRLTPYIDKSAAFGCFIDDFDGTKYFEHGGVDEGFISQYYGSLEGGNGLVVMINTMNGSLIPEIVNSVGKVYGFKGLDHSKLIKNVTVADSVLQTCTGDYQIEPGFILTISPNGNQLYGQATGQGELAIFPESQSKFYLKVADIEVEFFQDASGKITRLVFYQTGPHEAKKIK